jgi:hypothetical protein
MAKSNTYYKMTLEATGNRLKAEIEEAYKTIVELVRENGGLVKTPAASDKPAMHAVYDGGLQPGTQEVSIQALRWDDELGLTMCTNDMLENFQFDTGYCFDYFFDFEGEDAEHLEEVFADPAYFVEFDKYDLDRTQTILNLIAGLPAYL